MVRVALAALVALGLQGRPVTAAQPARLKLSLVSWDARRPQDVVLKLVPEYRQLPAPARKTERWRIAVPKAPAAEPVERELSPGFYRLTLAGPSVQLIDRAIEAASGGVVDLGVLRLQEGVTLAGAVLDETGTPVPRAGLMFHRTREPDEDFAMGRNSATSGLSGRFEVQGLRPRSTYEWWAHAVGFLQARGKWSGEPRLEVVLERAPRIYGRVVDDEGEPIRAALVGLEAKPGDGTSWSHGGETEANGGFSFHAHERDTTALSVEADGWLKESREIALLREGRLMAEIDLGTIRLNRGRRLTGRVLDGRNRTGIPGAVVQAIQPGDRHRDPPFQTSVSGEDGRFELAGLDPVRELILVAEKDGYARRRLAVGVDEPSPLEVLLGAGGRIAGKVCGASKGDGRMVVSISPANGRIGGVSIVQPRVEVGADGTFVAENVEPGSWQVARVWTRSLPEGGTSETVNTDDMVKVVVEDGRTAKVEIGCAPVIR